MEAGPRGEVVPAPFDRVVIVGAGLMGRGIAQACAGHGCEVVITDQSAACAEAAATEIDRGLAFLAERGIVSPAPAGVTCRVGLDDLPERVPVVVEAITEDLEAKRRLFAALEERFPRPTIFTSNTSSLRVTDMASGLHDPSRLIGMHFIMPAQVVPVVEIVRGEVTSDETLAVARAFSAAIGKRPIVVNRDIPGFVLNRLQHALHREAYHLMTLGVTTAEEIDLGVKLALAPRFLSTGLLEQKDLSGMEVHYAVAQGLYPDLCTDSVPRGVLPALIAEGRLGVRTGRGFFDWTGVDVPRHVERRLALHVAALRLAAAAGDGAR